MTVVTLAALLTLISVVMVILGIGLIVWEVVASGNGKHRA